MHNRDNIIMINRIQNYRLFNMKLATTLLNTQ